MHLEARQDREATISLLIYKQPGVGWGKLTPICSSKCWQNFLGGRGPLTEVQHEREASEFTRRQSKHCGGTLIFPLTNIMSMQVSCRSKNTSRTLVGAQLNGRI